MAFKYKINMSIVDYRNTVSSKGLQLILGDTPSHSTSINLIAINIKHVFFDHLNKLQRMSQTNITCNFCSWYNGMRKMCFQVHDTHVVNILFIQTLWGIYAITNTTHKSE